LKNNCGKTIHTKSPIIALITVATISNNYTQGNTLRIKQSEICGFAKTSIEVFINPTCFAKTGISVFYICYTVLHFHQFYKIIAGQIHKPFLFEYKKDIALGQCPFNKTVILQQISINFTITIHFIYFSLYFGIRAS
jgi:hypothetical protein